MLVGFILLHSIIIYFHHFILPDVIIERRINLSQLLYINLIHYVIIPLIWLFLRKILVFLYGKRKPFNLIYILIFLHFLIIISTSIRSLYFYNGENVLLNVLIDIFTKLSSFLKVVFYIWLLWIADEACSKYLRLYSVLGIAIILAYYLNNTVLYKGWLTFSLIITHNLVLIVICFICYNIMSKPVVINRNYLDSNV